MFKATTEEIDLHTRVIAGDEIASSQVFILYSDEIIRHLKLVFPKVTKIDEESIYEGVTDAFVSYIKDPSKFDPSRMTLFKYLKMTAEGDMKNIIDKKSRVKRKEGLIVELNDSIRNSSFEDENCEDESSNFEEQERIQDELLKQLLKNETDYHIAKLIIEGVRDTEPYVSVLNIGHLSKEDRKVQVKKVKDKVKIKIKRAYRNGIFKYGKEVS